MKTYADRVTTIRPPTWCSNAKEKGIPILNQQTIEKLHVMKLHGMADAFHAQLETTDTGQLSFEERLRCSWISNGYGRRTGLWPAGFATPT
jgi:hypothetical protein